MVNRRLAIPRSAKHGVAVVLGAPFCALATLLAIALRLETFPLLEQEFWLLVALSWAVALPLLAVFGAYHAIFRFSGECVSMSFIGDFRSSPDLLWSHNSMLHPGRVISGVYIGN